MCRNFNTSYFWVLLFIEDLHVTSHIMHMHDRGVANSFATLFGVEWRVTTVGQGCQIFLGTIYQNGENVQNDYKITKCPHNIPIGCIIL
jgi:hypothetical protein